MHLNQIILLFGGAVATLPAVAESVSHANATSLPEPSVPVSATRGPEPLNNPGTWVTTQDYPPQALRDNAEGAVGFQLAISPAGTVTDCNILASSGSPVLDQTACQLIRLRAQFRPAMAAGKPTTGTYSNRVRWVMPRPQKPLAGEFIISFLVGPDGARSDCKVERALGEGPVKALAQGNPCQSGNFDSGYVDQAGLPVTRRVRITLNTEVLPVP